MTVDSRRPLSGTFDDDPVLARSTRNRKSDLRLVKGRAKQADDLATEAFREGEREGRYQAKRTAAEKKARLRARKRKYPVARRVARRVRQPVSAGTARGISQASAPVASQVAGATKIAVTTMGVVALYLFLENATAVRGALGGVSRGLEWFKAPNKPVPYVRKQG